MSPATVIRRPRVLQCITRLGLGGAERVALSLVRGLHAEVDFAVFTVHGMDNDDTGRAMRDELLALEIPWFRGTSVPMKAGGMVPGGWALARAIRRFRPDVIHFHSETPEACGAAMLALFPRRPSGLLLRTIHNSVFWRYWPRVGRWCDRRLAPAEIACVSAAAREEFLRYRADSGVAALRAVPPVIYNGVDRPLQSAPAAPLRAGHRRVLFAGRFEFQKGTDLLAAALPLCRLPAKTTAELTLVGHGADAPRLQSLAASPPAGWTVNLTGAVASLAPCFAESDLVVMPSRFEGLGLVAIEATFAGRPVVTTDAPGLRETLPADYPWRARIDDAADLARALSAALSETERWPDAVGQAQAFARDRFAPERMLAGYRELYHRPTSGVP